MSAQLAASPKRLLMVVLEFPPAASAGVQRPLKFAQYLPEFGWEPIVLTVREKAYDRLDLGQELPKTLVHVYRSGSFNAARDFAVKGRYFSWSAEPDSWWSWIATGLPLGRRLIEELNPAAIWSTYPVATSHYLAYRLACFSGLPWLADFRDPFKFRQRCISAWSAWLSRHIEQRTIDTCHRAIFTTARAQALYRGLYPQHDESHFVTIQNGFDEQNFETLEDSCWPATNARFILLHSGTLYLGERDPEPVFKALAMLQERGIVDKSRFQLLFRGAQRSEHHHRQLDKLGIADLVEFGAPVGYKQSLSEMLGADGLLLLQGKGFKNQVPGKVYEYIRAQKPILAVTPDESATADTLQGMNGVFLVHEPDAIAQALESMFRCGALQRPEAATFSRRARTSELAALLDAAVAAPGESGR